MTRLLILAAALATVAGAARMPSAMASTSATLGCAQDSLGAQVLLQNMRTAATATTPPYTVVRDSLRIPAVAATQVTLVTDSTLCANLAHVYDSVLVARGDDSNPNRDVIVIQVGDRYAVQDPQEAAGEFRVTIILDGTFQYLSIF